MTDKEIIIDGINVSECRYALTPKNKPMLYAKETSCIACKEQITKYNFCKNNPNCYYKQLKRKEQECEELEKQLYNCNVIIDRFLIASGKSKDITQPEEFEEVFEDIEQTYSECEELKREIAFGSNGKLSDKIRATVFTDLSEENLKYKQALDEIKHFLVFDICESCNQAQEEDDVYCECEECNMQIILDIINNANTAPTTIFDKIRSFDSFTLARFIHALISCHENYTCDDCYIATLPFPKRICDTKETLSDIQNWLNE